MTRPLVTFAVGSYNQERFIREAVQGALAQTYSPLQILISDDCSQDGSFDIIKEAVSGYDGPHEISLNRNSRNLGTGGHCNRLMELAAGELIVVAAGDDISLPNRTEELVRAWSAGDVFSVYSDVVTIDEDGAVLEDTRDPVNSWSQRMAGSWQEMARTGFTGVNGSSHAWNRRLFEVFGPIPESVTNEDLVLPFRSALLGRVAYLDKKLVKYRRHTDNITTDVTDEADMSQFIGAHIEVARRYSQEHASWLRDLRLFASYHPEMETDITQAMNLISARIEFDEFKQSSLEDDRTSRWRNSTLMASRAKSLGVKHLAKVLLLGASPKIYYRLQRRYHRVYRHLKRLGS